MAIAFRHTTFHQSLALITALFQIVAGLPGGCGGDLEILQIESPTYNDTIWACSGIERSALFGGEAILLAASNQDNVTDCANYCATTSYPDGLMAGIWDEGNDNTTCECWYIGDLNYYNLPAAIPNVTFLDFFEAWNPGGRPSKAQNWGAFTCPAGAISGPADAGVPYYCGPLTIHPAHPALADLGILGGCAYYCSEYPGFQWVLSKGPSDCICYGDLAGLNVTLNYSSTDYVIDYYDFEPRPTTSSTSVATSTSTTTSSKSSSHSTSKTTAKSTSSHTSTTKKRSSKKKSSSKTSSTATSSKSIPHTSTPTSSTSKTSSKATSSKSTLHTSTPTSKTSSSKSTTHSTTKTT